MEVYPSHKFIMLVAVTLTWVATAALLPDRDPTWESVSEVYPLLAHSREALGVPDHPVAAALDIAKQSDPICTVVYPLEPPLCSPVTGTCTTSELGTARFTLLVTTAGAPGNTTIGLNCSHSSTRSLGETRCRGFNRVGQSFLCGHLLHYIVCSSCNLLVVGVAYCAQVNDHPSGK
jgi:hypothetical protein